MSELWYQFAFSNGKDGQGDKTQSHGKHQRKIERRLCERPGKQEQGDIEKSFDHVEVLERCCSTARVNLYIDRMRKHGISQSVHRKGERKRNEHDPWLV